MKIVFLNAWHGKMWNEIRRFIKEQSADTDVFCFQEVSRGKNLFCDGLLPNYRKIVTRKRVSADDNFSQAIYASKKFRPLSSEILLKSSPRTGVGTCALMDCGNKKIHICNFHGVSRPGDKLDNPDRIVQSSELINFLKKRRGPKIIGGDFNLLPKTKSISMFEKAGYRNLIKDFSIKTTRNELVWKRFDGEKQYFADYVFVNDAVKVKRFSVPDIKVSDHLPLILEIAT